MHTVDRLEQMMQHARQAGYTVRLEWLGGAGGGACEFAGRKWIFVDLALSVVEQLDQISSALKDEPLVPPWETPLPVQHRLVQRRAA